MPGTYSLKQLAELVQGKVEGNPETSVSGLNGLELAGPDEITFISNTKQIGLVAETQAGACVVPEFIEAATIPQIVVDRPDIAAARIHTFLVAKPFKASGVHPSSVVGESCSISQEVVIGPKVCIGNRVHIGDRVTISPGVIVEDDCVIGDDTLIHANVTLAKQSTIGKRVILHHGVVIGSDGFGFASDSMGIHYKKPQVGTVRIDDDVEIGANSCVDRAAFGVTWIKSGTRIDNLVQIAHNVVIGENSVVVAQVGIAGSTTVGRSVVIGGMVGVAGHLHIGDQVMIAAMSGVHNDQPPGAVIGGAPAIDARKWSRSAAVYNRLPELVKELRSLKKEVKRLSALLDSDEI